MNRRLIEGIKGRKSAQMARTAMPHFRTPDGLLVDFEVEKLGRHVLSPDYEEAVYDAYKPSWFQYGMGEAQGYPEFGRVKQFIMFQMWNDMKDIEVAVRSGMPAPAPAMDRIKRIAGLKHVSAIAGAWVRATCKFAGGIP